MNDVDNDHAFQMTKYHLSLLKLTIYSSTICDDTLSTVATTPLPPDVSGKN